MIPLNKPLRPAKPPGPTTLKDIAAATGVSINTVSRALRGKDDISEETRERIMRAAGEMGYVNNMIASSLRLGYTNTIAVLLGDISNPFFGVLMRNIEKHARLSGYASFLINTSEDDAVEYEAIRTALNKNVDGIIICPTQHHDDNLRFLMRSGTPFVQIGRHFPKLAADFVACDDERGGYLATMALIQAGHRKILMANGPRYISSAQARLAGYRRALRENGLAAPGKLVREIGLAAEHCDDVVRDIRSGRIDCTAIFAFSDLMTLGLWSSLRRAGIRVPEDLSLVGFDNCHPQLAAPFALASVSYLSEGMGEKAVEVLVEKMQNHPENTAAVVIQPRFVEGETIAPPARPMGVKPRSSALPPVRAKNIRVRS